MDAWLEIHRPDGTVERQPIEGEKATVGRSPSANIPLPDARSLDPEHLMLMPRPDGCWVAVAQGAITPAYVRGEPFQHGVVAWGTEIEIGPIRFCLLDSRPEEKKKSKGGSEDSKVSAPTMVLLLILVPLVGWLLLDEGEVELTTHTDAAPPELFWEMEQCEPPPGGTAQYLADASALAARAKRERYPFDEYDGVESVMLFRRARVCYHAVGQDSQAGEMQGEGERMQARVEEDYGTTRLRLERALEHQRYESALLATRRLTRLLSSRRLSSDPYVLWLQQLERQLRMRLQAATS